jgi:hypothetical protein
LLVWGALSLWDIWPIGSVVAVAGIVVFLGMELLAYWMNPKAETEDSPEADRDAFSKKSAYSLTALILLFVLVCLVLGVAMLLEK